MAANTDKNGYLKEKFHKNIMEFTVNLGNLLTARKWKIAVAESCTGGMLGSIMTAVPGSSEWFTGGVIAYSNAIKENILGVSAEILKKYGAVSRQAACAMACGVIKLMKTEMAIAITGIAGPTGGTPRKPVGTVWIAVINRLRYKEKKFQFDGEREMVRLSAAAAALQMAVKSLKYNGGANG